MPKAERPSWDEYFMATAVLMASRSNCERLHVGCVIVTGGTRKNRLVAAGSDVTQLESIHKWVTDPKVAGNKEARLAATRAIESALERHEGNRRLAARDLNISERTLYRKIKEYGLAE